MTMGVKGRASVALLVLAAFTAGILAATSGANWLGAGDRVGTASRAADSAINSTPSDADLSAAAFDEAFVTAAERVKVSVVQIRSEQVRKMEGNQAPNPFDGTPFQNFFRMPDQQPQEFRSEALGSGVIIRDDGYIVTNNHVVANAEELQVVLDNGTFHEATLVGTDPESDLAVIKIDAARLPTVEFGSIDQVRVGQWVLAFGSPLSSELGNTVTSGIVSALHRTSRNLSQLNLFAPFIQTDAAINPGNSGGPLVNLSGDLIGINSAIFSRSGGSQGIGFAIPVDIVESVTRQLIDSGSVERGFLGVNFDAVSPALAAAMKVNRGAAQVTRVTEDSPADDAGLQEGDVITAVNGQELRGAEELRTTIGNMAPDDKVTLTVMRDGRPREVVVELGNRKDYIDEATTAAPADKESEDAVEAIGLSLQSLDSATAQRLGLPENTRGAVVASIDQGSDAYRNAEIRQGDVIVEANRKPVKSADDFKEILKGISSGDHFMVKVVRGAQGEARSYFTALTKP